MADTFHHPNSALDDGLPRPVASLTDLPIRRSPNAESTRAAKPGDLTEELNKRRGQSPMNGAGDVEGTDPASAALAPVTEIVDAAVEAPESVAETTEPVTETADTTADSPPPNGEAPESVTETAAPAMEDGAATVVSNVAEPVPDVAEPVPYVAEPASNVAEPASNVAEPASNVAEPASNVAEPMSEAAEPVSEAAEPMSEAAEPVSEAAEPVSEAAEPVSNVAEPVSNVAEPVFEAAEPVFEAAEPVFEAAEPVFEAAEPVSEAVEPVSEAVEPHASPAPMDDAAPPPGAVGADAAADADAYVDSAAVDGAPDYIAQEPSIETAPAAPQQPAPTAMQQPEPGDDGQAVAGNGVEPPAESPPGAAVTGTELRKRMAGLQDETPQPEAMSSEESGPGSAEAETSTPQDDDGGEAPSDESSAKGRFRLSKKQERETVLRSRMAAVLEKETRRREAWEARRTERGDQASSAPPPRPVIQQYDDIFRYWSSERRGRPLPALSNLDQDVIARQWPDTLLLRYTARTNHLELTRNFAKPEDDTDNANTPPGKIDFTPSVIEWVLSQGRAAASEENPVRATEELDTRWGTAQYRVVALPLAEDGRAIDHVLCHIEPA